MAMVAITNKTQPQLFINRANNLVRNRCKCFCFKYVQDQAFKNSNCQK